MNLHQQEKEENLKPTTGLWHYSCLKTMHTNQPASTLYATQPVKTPLLSARVFYGGNKRHQAETPEETSTIVYNMRRSKGCTDLLKILHFLRGKALWWVCRESWSVLLSPCKLVNLAHSTTRVATLHSPSPLLWMPAKKFFRCRGAQRMCYKRISERCDSEVMNFFRSVELRRIYQLIKIKSVLSLGC